MKSKQNIVKEGLPTWWRKTLSYTVIQFVKENRSEVTHVVFFFQLPVFCCWAAGSSPPKRLIFNLNSLQTVAKDKHPWNCEIIFLTRMRVINLTVNSKRQRVLAVQITKTSATRCQINFDLNLDFYNFVLLSCFRHSRRVL